MYNLAFFHYSEDTINSHELKYCRIYFVIEILLRQIRHLCKTVIPAAHIL